MLAVGFIRSKIGQTCTFSHIFARLICSNNVYAATTGSKAPKSKYNYTSKIEFYYLKCDVQLSFLFISKAAVIFIAKQALTNDEFHFHRQFNNSIAIDDLSKSSYQIRSELNYKPLLCHFKLIELSTTISGASFTCQMHTNSTTFIHESEWSIVRTTPKLNCMC